MKLGLIGVGNAGTQIVDRLVAAEDATGRNLTNQNVVCFDTAEDGFLEIDHVREGLCYTFGDTHPAMGADGTEGDPDLGVLAAREDVNEIRRAFDDLEFTAVDALLVVAGLGGGTGGGAGAVILEELQAICENPVYALGLVPANDEGDQQRLNAARALPSVVRLADNTLLVDVESWGVADEESAGEDAISVATDRVISLFGAGEIAAMPIAETRIDASDTARTLETGGVSTIGQASRVIERDGGRWGWLPDWLASLLGVGDDEPSPTDAVKVKELVEQALANDLTMPAAVESADRGLVVLSGPPSAVSRKGFEAARYWLEQETDTVEVLAGDEPRPDTATLTANVLLSNVTDVPRIDALQDEAVGILEGLEADDVMTEYEESTAADDADRAESADGEEVIAPGAKETGDEFVWK